MYGGRDPCPSPSSSFGREHAVHGSEDEHSDLPLLFDIQPPQFKYLQSFIIKPLPLSLKALHGASRDSLKFLPESERDFINVWSI